MNNCKIKGCTQFAIRDDLCAKHFIYKNSGDSKYKATLKKFPWHNLYYTNTWRKLRAMHLSGHPLCVMCGHVGDQVDHIIDHKGNLDLFYDAENLQSLCRKCHMKKTFFDADYYSLKPSKERSITIDLVDESECQMLNLMKSIGVEKDTDYLYKLLMKRDDNIFKLSSKVYIIKLYKMVSIYLGEKPKLHSNVADIQNIL